MVKTRSKMRGDGLLNPGRNSEGQMEEELKTDAPKWDESMVPVYMWDIREC